MSILFNIQFLDHRKSMIRLKKKLHVINCVYFFFIQKI